MAAEQRPTLGEFLYDVRTQADLSLRGAGKRADLDHAHISQIEKGDREPQIGTVVALMRALNISPGELFETVYGVPESGLRLQAQEIGRNVLAASIEKQEKIYKILDSPDG